MEQEMEPETLEARISECPGGARAGPEPEPGARGGPLPGGGGVRGAPSSRPAPGLGGAVPQAAPSDPGVKTPLAAPPTHPIPGRRPPEGSELSWTLRPEPPNGEISPQTPSGPDFSTQERTLKSFPWAPGGCKQVHCCTSDSGGRDPAPLVPRILHPLALHVVIPFYPFLESAATLRCLLFLPPRKGGPLGPSDFPKLWPHSKKPPNYRFARARLRLQK